MSGDLHADSPSLTALDRGARTARAALADLADERRRAVDGLADAWVGGHRDRFADDVARLERRVRDRLDALDALVRCIARAGDAPGAGA